MAIKDLISPGIGFTPGSIKFILTRGLGIGAAVANVGPARIGAAESGSYIRAVLESGSRIRVVAESGSYLRSVGQ